MKIYRAFLAAALAAVALPASAGIVFSYGAADSVARYYAGGAVMPTLVMVPGAAISPQISYQMQRARAWSNYRRGDNASGGALVFAPAFGGNGVSSYGQSVVSAHLSRANAYRLGYYK